MGLGFWPWIFQEGCHKILQNLLEWKLVSSGKLVFFQKSIALSPRSIFFWNNPIWNVEHVYYITMYFLFNFAWYSIQLDIVCWFLLNRQNLLTKSVKLDENYLLRIPKQGGGLHKSVKNRKLVTKIFFSVNGE